MNNTINSEAFALAVVTSKGFEGTADEIAKASLELYKAAYNASVQHNEPIIEEEKRIRDANNEAFLNAFGK